MVNGLINKKGFTLFYCRFSCHKYSKNSREKGRKLGNNANRW